MELLATYIETITQVVKLRKQKPFGWYDAKFIGFEKNVSGFVFVKESTVNSDDQPIYTMGSTMPRSYLRGPRVLTLTLQVTFSNQEDYDNFFQYIYNSSEFQLNIESNIYGYCKIIGPITGEMDTDSFSDIMNIRIRATM